jgi:hypothetical protein
MSEPEAKKAKNMTGEKVGALVWCVCGWVAASPSRASARHQRVIAAPPPSSQVVLAYSGGLDTSVILKWLSEKGFEVIW